jgi:hypothetical protein
MGVRARTPAAIPMIPGLLKWECRISGRTRRKILYSRQTETRSLRGDSFLSIGTE